MKVAVKLMPNFVGSWAIPRLGIFSLLKCESRYEYIKPMNPSQYTTPPIPRASVKTLG